MANAVSNSSPLILLAKTRALDILTFFYDKIFIPPAVHHQVVEEGLNNAHVDALLIKKLEDDQKIIVQPGFQHVLQGQQFINNNLHPGEVDAIELALAIKVDVILLDDDEARKIARACNLPVKGTLGLLVDYTKAGKIGKDAALKILGELSRLMYLSADLYQFVEHALK